MTLSEEQIDWIVMEVIRRLGLLRVARNERSSSAACGELIVAERVVTMRSIEGRLAGVKRLVAEPRAVVTPAVKDELKKRKIELVVRSQ
jgi:hypothetical protein